MKTFEIARDDIDTVAESINRWVFLDRHYDAIIEQYAEAQESDPTASWDLIVEQLIYDIVLYSTIEVELLYKGEEETQHYLFAYPDDDGDSLRDDELFFYLETEDYDTEIEAQMTDAENADWRVIRYGSVLEVEE